MRLLVGDAEQLAQVVMVVRNFVWVHYERVAHFCPYEILLGSPMSSRCSNAMLESWVIPFSNERCPIRVR